MKKIALVVMLLATSAFGAASLSLDTTTLPATGGTVALMLNIDGGSLVAGYNGWVTADKPGVTVTRTLVEGSMFFDPNTASVNNRPIPPAVDVGGTVDDPFTGKSESGKLMDLTFAVTDETALPITITISGSWTTPLDENFEFIDTPFAPLTLTITPEPASMLLLAAGAAFFARRRRA